MHLGWAVIGTRSKTMSDCDVDASSELGNAPGVLLPQCSFLVTSRPFASSSLVSCIPSTISMEALPADDITSYSTQYFSTQESKKVLFSIKARPSAYSLCSLPMHQPGCHDFHLCQLQHDITFLTFNSDRTVWVTGAGTTPTSSSDKIRPSHPRLSSQFFTASRCS